MKIRKINYDVVNYVIPNYKLRKESIIKVLLLADLHNYVNNHYKREDLANKINFLKPHHIVIAGDIMQGDEWDDMNKISKLAYFLSSIGEECKVFLSLGNHDLWGNNKGNEEGRIANFKKLEKIKNIYPLYNEKVNFDNFQILNYTPKLNIIDDNTIQDYGLAHNLFINEFNKYGVKIDKCRDYITEFVGHNPHLIEGNKKVGLDGLESVDTFYTGHLHNGYRSYKKIINNPDKYLDNGYTERPWQKDIDGKILLKTVNPLMFSKTNLCRGVVYLDNDGKVVLLELRNGHFYINIGDNFPKENWVKISNRMAFNLIINNQLKALVISGGVKKFSYFSDMFLNVPELTMVTYQKIK